MEQVRRLEWRPGEKGVRCQGNYRREKTQNLSFMFVGRVMYARHCFSKSRRARLGAGMLCFCVVYRLSDDCDSKSWSNETISISPWNDGRPRSGEGHVLWRREKGRWGGWVKMKKKRPKQRKNWIRHMRRGWTSPYCTDRIRIQGSNHVKIRKLIISSSAVT